MTDWKTDLDEFFTRQERLEQADKDRRAKEMEAVNAFVGKVVLPAFEQLRAHLEKHGREVEITSNIGQATITVIYEGFPEILYRLYAAVPQPMVEYAYISAESGQAVKASDVITEMGGGQDAALELSADRLLSISEITQEIVIGHFIRKYKSVAG